MALKIIELLVDDSLTGDTKVEEIALVLQPAIETEFMWFNKQTFETYNDYPEAAKENACKVLRWRDEHGDDVKGMTQVGWTRANQLCKGENISRDTIARMSAFIRHQQNADIADEYKGEPWKDAGYVAWLGWGGTEGVEWASRKLKQIDEEMGIDTGNLQPWAKTNGDVKITGDTDMCGCGGQYEMEEDGPCWEGYEMIGWKEEGGRKVPNCVPKEELSQNQIGQIQKGSLITGDDCGCGCPDMDGCNGEGGLYFGTTMINGMPVFESAEEAESYADQLGCSGSHIHIIDGKEYYMPCEIHSETITDKVIEEIEDRGVELEDLLKQGWDIVDVNQVDEEMIKKQMASKFNKMKPEEFYSIITTPGEASVQDLGNKRFRYVYSTGFGPDLINTSRSFCRRMLGGRQFVFRYEDIMALSAAIDSEADNYKIIPRPKGTSVDIFSYKGGANCRHFWTQLIFQPSMASIVAEQTPQEKITNNARREKEKADYTIPAPNQSGQLNPPVDYGSRSPQSVGFTRSSSQVIIVDMDDTLVRGNNPIQKTIDYVNRKAESYRIVIVSGRPASRTEETKRQLDKLGVKWDDIFLSDFPQGPNSSNAYKEYKAKWLMDKGLRVVEAIDNDSEARRLYGRAGVKAVSPTSLSAIPKGFLQGLAIFEEIEDAKSWSENMGCSGMVEEVIYLGKKMFQACGYNINKNKMSAQFSVDDEKRMLYSPAMKPGILIPRMDEMTREKYFVTFKPETIERMAQRFLIEKRTDKTNYEHSDQKFEGVYLVESWIVSGEQDKAYSLGYKKEEIPMGTWMVGYRVDNDEVWDMIKQGKVKGLSIEGNFEYKFSVEDNDEYLLSEIINILKQINQ
jgi:hypothetical protein